MTINQKQLSVLLISHLDRDPGDLDLDVVALHAEELLQHPTHSRRTAGEDRPAPPQRTGEEQVRHDADGGDSQHDLQDAEHDGENSFHELPSNNARSTDHD